MSGIMMIMLVINWKYMDVHYKVYVQCVNVN